MKTLRGFTIRAQRQGVPAYEAEYVHGWVEKGKEPEEWKAIKKDETIVRAELYNAAQRNVRADKRKFLDRLER